MPDGIFAFFFLGVLFAAVYDFFRFLRLVFSSKHFAFAIDFIFFIIISNVFFIFLLGYNNGEVRVYYFTASFLGFLLYIFTIFRLTLKIERKEAAFLRNILKKCSKTLKKVLQFIRRVYYNISMLRHKPLRKKTRGR